MGEYFGNRDVGSLVDREGDYLFRTLKAYECLVCSALVTDKQAHTDWHEARTGG